VSVPFQAGVKGAATEVEFQTPLAKYYVFYLDLYHDPDNGDPRSPQRLRDRERVEKLAGSSGYNPRTMQRVDNGLPIPVRLTVTLLGAGTSRTVLDGVYSSHEMEGYGSAYFSKIVARARLEPGRYHARIEALENLPALSDVPIRFDVHVPGNAK
jgi:hypothetical protein